MSIFTDEEVMALGEHLTQEGTLTIDDRVELLQSLYSKLPRNFHYTGRIYRGLPVKKKNVLELLHNGVFNSSDKDNLIESWVYKLESAFEFASFEVAQVYTDMIVGVILESDTRYQEVIGVFNIDVYNYLSENVRSSLALDYLENMWKSRNEFEVIVKSKGAAGYTLCDDVNYIMINNRNVFLEDVFDIKESLMLKMDQHSVEVVKKFIEEEDVPIASIYTCNKEGDLKLFRAEYVGWLQTGNQLS